MVFLGGRGIQYDGDSDAIVVACKLSRARDCDIRKACRQATAKRATGVRFGGYNRFSVAGGRIAVACVFSLGAIVGNSQEKNQLIESINFSKILSIKKSFFNYSLAFRCQKWADTSSNRCRTSST